MSFYVTTPIYYVNAEPHLGHAYSTMAADVLARHMRQRGEDVFFLTGTDEHGEPVAQAAEREGVTPKELADRNAARFRELMPRINASNDFFIRTSDHEHVKAVQDVLSRVRDNGFVELGTYEGWYCPRCADFKSENEIAEGNRCPIHLIELTRESETSRRPCLTNESASFARTVGCTHSGRAAYSRSSGSWKADRRKNQFSSCSRSSAMW